MTKVFIGSTGLDLEAYREAARDECLRMGFQPEMMEYWEAMDAGATEASLNKLKGCDLYIGIFAHRYGYCEDGYEGKSVTEMEYEAAPEVPMERLCFLVDAHFPWPTDMIEFDKKPQMDAFKAKVRMRVDNFFGEVNDFRAKLTASLSAWKDRHPQTGGGLGATLVNIPGDVPERARKLIGRDEKLAEGLAALRPGEPCLLHGFGGMGKTALAAEVAANWIEQNGWPALWLRVGNLPFEGCSAALARALRGQAIDAAALKTLLRESGAGLVVLDDAWNGAALEALLKAMPGEVCALVTSRRRYPVDGNLIEVGRLAEADALALLAAHARKDFGADAAGLVNLLGCHAFSVEVAGRTMKARGLSPVEMVAQIADAPDRMEMPADYGPEERRSVKRLLDASFEGLPSERDQQVFLAFGALFSTQATPEMLGLLTGMEAREAKSALDELADNGLAERVPEDQPKNVEYYRIHDLAASYARVQATPEQLAAAVDACLTYMGRYQEQGHASFAALRPELDNLLGAAGRAVVLRRSEDCERFAWGLYPDGGILNLQGYYNQALTLMRLAADAAKLRGDRQTEGSHLIHLGHAYRALGHVKEAISVYEQALIIARETGNQQSEGNALGGLGIANAVIGQNEKGVGFFEQALEIAREIGNRRGEGNALGNLGNVYAAMGQMEKAIDFHKQWLVIAREIGDKIGEGNALGNLGYTYDDLDEYEKAIGYYEQALIISREIGDRMGEGTDLNNMGTAYENLGQLERALELYQQGRAIRVEIGVQHLVKRSDANIASVEAKLKGGELTPGTDLGGNTKRRRNEKAKKERAGFSGENSARGGGAG